MTRAAILYVTVILAGIIGGAGVLFPAVWYFAIFGVALFSYALAQLPSANTRQIFFSGWVFGIAYCGTAILWFWHILPLDWIGIPHASQGFILVGFCCGTVALVAGTLFGAFSYLYLRFKTDSWHDILFAASLWTIVQYLQMWAFAVLTYGDGSVFGAHFSPFFVGYSLASFSPTLQMAAYGGIYALTFVAVAIGCALYRFLPNSITRRALFCIAIMLFFAMATHIDQTYTLIRTKENAGQTITAAIVSTNFMKLA